MLGYDYLLFIFTDSFWISAFFFLFLAITSLCLRVWFVTAVVKLLWGWWAFFSTCGVKTDLFVSLRWEIQTLHWLQCRHGDHDVHLLRTMEITKRTDELMKRQAPQKTIAWTTVLKPTPPPSSRFRYLSVRRGKQRIVARWPLCCAQCQRLCWGASWRERRSAPSATDGPTRRWGRKKKTNVDKYSHTHTFRCSHTHLNM